MLMLTLAPRQEQWRKEAGQEVTVYLLSQHVMGPQARTYNLITILPGFPKQIGLGK